MWSAPYAQVLDGKAVKLVWSLCMGKKLISSVGRPWNVAVVSHINGLLFVGRLTGQFVCSTCYFWLKNVPSFLSSVVICVIRRRICLFKFTSSEIVEPESAILDVISSSVFL